MNGEVPNMSKFCCPNCGSENIQKMQIVYQSGTGTRSSVTTYENRAGYTMESETNEQHSTNLAASVAPPNKKETHFGFTIICGIVSAYFIYCLFQHFSWFDLIVGGIAGLLAFGGYESSMEVSAWNENEYPKLYEEWANSFICHKCGHRFVIR